jgi:hypothetical protein
MCVLLLGPAQAEAPAEVELVRDGRQRQLSDAARAHIIGELPKLFATCSLDSRNHPATLRDPSVAEWNALEAKDRLSIRFAAPINVGHPQHQALPARELILGLADARFPGPELSRNGESVVAHAKCSGGDLIRFVCAPEIRPLMPDSYQPLCSWLEQHGPRAFGK